MYRTILKEQLKHDEGLRLIAYKDTVGKITIGYGRNIDDMGITYEEAELMLDTDTLRAEMTAIAYLGRELWNQLNDNRKAVIANMAFNMGLNRIRQFKRLKAALEIKDYEAAAKEMLNSKWASQVKGRATRLAKIMKEV